jgi:hypothetical protein
MFGAPLVSPDAGPIPGVPLDQPKNLFRFGEQSLWSTQLHVAGTALSNGTFRTFTTPQGQVGQGFVTSLSISETNLKEGGRVPSGVAYDVFGVAGQIMASSDTADDGNFTASFNRGSTQVAPVAGVANQTSPVEDIQNIVNNGVLSWDFTQTVVDICPLMLAGGGGGLFGSVATGTGDEIGNLSNGSGGVWMYRKHPVALPGNTTFAVVVRYGSRAGTIGASNGAAVRLVLLGYYKNVIEIG